MAVATITPDTRADWLAQRKLGIGSSDAAAVLGLSPWKTPLAVYLDKIGEAGPTEETEAMQLGLLLEPVIAKVYSDRTGHDFLAEQPFIRHERLPWLLATLDRIRDDGRIVELKAVGARQVHEWGESGSDEVPRWYTVQVLHQMAAAGIDEADVAALICGQELRIYHLERDEQVIATMLEREEEFWDRVTRREPPVIDPEKDARLLSRLFPDCVGEIDFGQDATQIVQAWEALGKQVRDGEKARERMRTDILLAMENAASAKLSDGRLLTRKVIHVDAATIERKAYDRIDLRVKGESNG